MSAITCDDAILTPTIAILQAAGERSEEIAEIKPRNLGLQGGRRRQQDHDDCDP